MKSIFLYSDDLYLIGRWMKLIDYPTIIIEELSDLLEIKKGILIVNNAICTDIPSNLIVDFVNNQNQVLLLDNLPNFLTAQKCLSNGIKGYGNTLMTKSYLNSAIEALNNNFIWLLPDITTQLVKDIVDSNEQSSKNKDNLLFKDLTHKEKKVASLLKKGYTNFKISEELNISVNTVKTHIKHIYEKLNVKDRLSFASLFSQ
ncbi:response regulator transcription factor [Halarcobacter anaerophilus]|uniref:Helix-turn-helix transcriptional regulator n=1 Tax=Halarcobacter anaerophilus TaxID=877500 RepID=A0A4Q0Y126_9BACT|nr:LuxR C-terminal-related transcriptional regulator [Halarcobacter anaerophilus]QDF28722.1 DNA-binding response regulator, NarL/FixJ family [Halarcobacter anaerophilus]RXJ61911.1 helix-turn-helix transcriptional regulator [Halarcobacter anaerophilus]